jgi:beta-mannosidase
MTRRIALEDGWRLKGYLGHDWALEAARNSWEGDGWIAASVPGSVGHDLVAAGEAPNPYVERNSLALEWAADRAWRDSTGVRVPALAGDEWAILRFEGVDHEATVLWDGAEIGHHVGMFTPFEVVVPGTTGAAAAHRLDVVVGPAPESEPQGGRTSRVRIHKSRMSYGWDFCPRLVHQGVWRPVSLVVAGPVRLSACTTAVSISDDLGRATLDVRVGLGAAPHAPPVEADVRAALLDGTATVTSREARIRVRPGATTATLRLDVDAPRLWWPNGFGEPALYELVVSVSARDGTPLDEHRRPVGFRTVRLVPNEGGPAGARGYTFEVNGTRVYATGWNWVPGDVFHGVPRPALTQHLLRLAADANVVLLRVWGGGLIESEPFYDACDRLGIMVWQELSQSSSGIDSVPSTDPTFVRLMAQEARAVAPRVAAHPSLVLWCGGNELADDAGPLDERSPVLSAIRDALAEVDPGRPWLPTSPTGPRFHNRLEDIEADPDGLHDVHGPWEHQGLDAQARLYDAGTSLLNSEFGVEGMANRRQLEALIRAEHRWPPDRTNPVYRHLGDWWNNAPLVQASFGGRISNVDAMRRASQHLQAEGLRYAVEANRRREPRHSGSLPWQLNESFPNAWCTSAVDHRGDPKPAYFAVRRAYAPVHVTARFPGWAMHGRPMTVEAWAWSAREPLIGAMLEVRAVTPAGAVLASVSAPVDLEAGRPRASWALELPSAAGLVVVDLALRRDGGLLASNRYVLGGGDDLAPLFDLAPADVRVDALRRDGDTWHIELAHVGGPAALGLVVDDDRPIDLPGWAEASDGWFELLPGESRTLDVRWADAPADGRRLRLHGWNVDVAID